MTHAMMKAGSYLIGAVLGLGAALLTVWCIYAAVMVLSDYLVTR